MVSECILALVDSFEPKMYEKHDFGCSAFKLSLMSASFERNSTCTVTLPSSHKSVQISTNFVDLLYQLALRESLLSEMTEWFATSSLRGKLIASSLIISVNLAA